MTISFAAVGYCMAIPIFVRSKMLDEHEDMLIDEYLKAYEDLRGGKALTEKCGWKSMHCHT